MAVKLDTLAAMLFDACFVGYLTRIHANNSQGSGCNSWSRSQSSWARTPSRGRASKVPQWCGCGLRPVLKWLGTVLNPDRPFYGCPKYNTSGQRWCGFFVWADGEEDKGTEGRAHLMAMGIHGGGYPSPATRPRLGFCYPSPPHIRDGYPWGNTHGESGYPWI
ncbi:hypothetical protein PIB30_051058 [Stylosanthes scabra]|uniref:GRF-type domain-containing protein n=1 Tax=Stylosanthes scabra TaxID=79078 RepID=A0ABU6SIL9_9FABA|nr:hypothetical protein [Stylosanthes scabra]